MFKTIADTWGLFVESILNTWEGALSDSIGVPAEETDEAKVFKAKFLENLKAGA
jgi:hypothetical protein